MERRNNIMMKSMQWSFALLSIAVFIFFLLGELLLPSERSEAEHEYSVWEAEWERISLDGSTEPIEVPGECEAARGENVRIQSVLPVQLEQGQWLCVRSSLQDIDIYVDGELRTHYTTENTRPFGKNSASAYVFTKLYQEDAGKIIEMSMVSDSAYSGSVSAVYIGEQIGIWMYLCKEYGWQLFVAIFLLILSVISILFSTALQIAYNKRIMLKYMGWGIFFGAVWLIGDSKLRQLFFPNNSVIYALCYFAVMLIPFPFLIYMNGIQKERYQRWYFLMTGIGVCNFIFCSTLQILNVADFRDSMIFMHLVLLMEIVLFIITLILDARKGYINEYKQVIIGIIGMIVAALVEIFLVYQRQYYVSGLMLCAGMIFLLAMTVWMTCKEILGMEREKERVMVAGESKSKFLANMSHEIRTPINTILGMNEMILRENKDEVIQNYAYNIQKDGKTLLSLINDVLDFSQIESGALQIEEREYYLASLLNDVIHGIQSRAAKKKLEVRLNIETTLPSVLCGDEVRVKQILTNLLTNAVKYTKEGNITFSVQGEPGEEGEIILKMSVADTGMGIREEDMDKLFERFSRLDTKKNRSIEGTGLGLSITKQLVERMNGEIQVQSVFGKGSLFTVKIPQKILKDEAIGDLSMAYDEEVKSSMGYQEILYAPGAVILAVDDNDMNLEVIRGLLKKTGIQIDIALSGEECLSMCRNKRYDLIFMDHMMPELDGIETLHLLREESENPNVQTNVVVLTANAVTGSKEEYLKEGFCDYLTKPIEIKKLEDVLRVYLKAFLQKEDTKSETEPEKRHEIAKKEEMTVAGQRQTDGENSTKDERSGEEKTKVVWIDRKLGMSYCGNNDEMYHEMLGAYCEQGEKYLQLLTEYHDQRDWKNYGVKVHAVKSTSLTIGAKEFSEQAKEQEMQAKEGKEEQLLKQWEGFLANYQSVLAEVKALYLSTGEQKQEEKTEVIQEETKEETQEEAVKAEWVSEKDFEQECRLLLEKIQTYETKEALEMIARMQGWKIKGADTKSAMEVLKQVQKAVDEFDYDSAEAGLIDWLQK